MDFTLGLDFGTHQSKLCLSYTPSNETIYEFIEFKKDDDTSTILFPSILQINEDETISVGFVDPNKCKGILSPRPQKPAIPDEPSLEIPREPQRTIIAKPTTKKSSTLDWKEALSKLFHSTPKVDPMEEWRKKQTEADALYRAALNQWEEARDKILEEHKNWEDLKSSILRDYEHQCLDWEANNKIRQSYRYFKLASLSNVFAWDQNLELSANVVSVWYLTYLMLYTKKYLATKFNANFEEDVRIQMGVPSSLNKSLSSQINNHAKKLLISARELMDLFDSPEQFCQTNYHDILSITKIERQNIKDTASILGLDVIPEAFAGLQSLTNRKRLAQGYMHLLVDIGGGTTDVAFFTIRKDDLTPNIHSVKSFHRGLNFVFEHFCKSHPSYSISDAQDLFFKNQSSFSDSIKEYNHVLKDELNKMIAHIESEFLRSCAEYHISIENLRQAMSQRPIVYCGGGSMYDSMRIANKYFSDIKVVNKTVLDIPNLVNNRIDSSLFTILATSYGLSIPLPIDEETGDTIEIKNTDIKELFDAIIYQMKEGDSTKKTNIPEDYDLADD